MKVRLWFIHETEKARLYSKLPAERNPTQEDQIWIARSLVKHTSKEPSGLHILDIEDWFAEKNNL
jgi:hypothetical protein